MLPGQTRPASQTPGGPVNGGNGTAPANMSMHNSNFPGHPHLNPNHHWVNPNQQNAHGHSQMTAQHPNQFQMNSLGRDGSFGMPGSLPPIHFKPAQGQSGPVAQTQSFARQARRLYVGNILHTANEMNVAEFFNAKMKELGLLARNNEDGMAISISENPVVAVQVNHEKNYAFVEVSLYNSSHTICSYLSSDRFYNSCHSTVSKCRGSYSWNVI
jgi:splicing factor U2AF subunit